MTLEVASKLLREEDQMTSYEVALAVYLRHVLMRVDTLAEDQSVIADRLTKGEQN